jgi:hypothetical protein
MNGFATIVLREYEELRCTHCSEHQKPGAALRLRVENGTVTAITCEDCQKVVGPIPEPPARLEMLTDELVKLKSELIQTSSQIMAVRDFIAEEIVQQSTGKEEHGHNGDGSHAR